MNLETIGPTVDIRNVQSNKKIADRPQDIFTKEYHVLNILGFIDPNVNKTLIK